MDWRGSRRGHRMPGMAALARAATGEPFGEAVEHQIDDRRGVEREHLAHDEPAHDRDAERLAEAGAPPPPRWQPHAPPQRPPRRDRGGTGKAPGGPPRRVAWPPHPRAP